MKKKIFKFTAHVVLLANIYQLIFPVCAHALTTGPSQPEVQSFQAVGMTDMVDMFSGSFGYNVPLLDVEGYPVNISYRSGINMDQEASWVGLGWNINPGEINRTVRGLPDDFNGDLIEKELNMKDESNTRVGVGVDVSVEVFGNKNDKLTAEAGLYVNTNSITGESVGIDGGVSISVPHVSVGVKMGIGSQTGGDIDLSATGTFKNSDVLSENMGTGVSVSGGTGFNTRSGLKDISFGISATLTEIQKTSPTQARGAGIGLSGGVTIPIGTQNYVPVVTYKNSQNSYKFQIKFGGAIWGTFISGNLSLTKSKLKYEQDGSRKGYGYIYSQNAANDAILDFDRDKEGIYNKTVANLPASSLTYDIYSITGQGTGGMFRPFRNDIGSIYDPYTDNKSTSQGFGVEGGIGTGWEVGADYDYFDNENSSGPWNQMPFAKPAPGTLFENVFFKQGGELTYNQQQSATQIFNDNPEYLGSDMSVLTGIGMSNVQMPGKFNNAYIYWNGATIDRSSRANLLTYLTAAQASDTDAAQSQMIQDFQENKTNPFDPVIVNRPRYTGSDAAAKADHISEFTQTLPDGRRYVYGIPAMNNITREVTFDANENNADFNTGLVSYAPGVDDSKNNTNGTHHFYSATNTPAYAHSYLLTSVLSNDYVDVMGDGPTDDDLGTFVKFNYSRVDSDYRWRSPYQSNIAQFDPGFWSDRNDGKGNYIQGSRHQWYLRSIESKNFIAEFYTTPRSDGKGITSSVLDDSSKLQGAGYLKSAKTDSSFSYKLDSIKLYNKHDRYLNEGAAIPVKTIIFDYGYTLCPGVPNTTGGAGKLTLNKIFIRYGNSNKNLLSPYTFSYSGSNPSYNFGAKDRWGNYQVNAAPKTNYEFPYTAQDTGKALDDAAASWSLTDIKLPSGGKIHVSYERNDYSFVQDRRAMQMFDIEGVGNSPNLQHKSELYESETDINDYVYFRRRISSESPNLSLRDNYLDGMTWLYYNFDLDITGTGKFDHVKSYAKIADFGICPNDPTSCWIRVNKESAGNMLLHPATIYGINTARYYLNQLFYPGFNDGDGDDHVLKGLLAAADELHTLFKNPFRRFVDDSKGKALNIPNSCIRLQTPGLSKKGGGIRVKQLTLADNWNNMSSTQDSATYGKQYDYTMLDKHYGVISSGVASYEPMIGGDENPFRLPVPYTAEDGTLLPAVDFFQEEPFGERFFPSASVGYSSVKVTSININKGNSAQASDEYLFYTARDFPLEVNYTTKADPGTGYSRNLSKMSETEQALQGYTLKFNDMHGKPMEVNNYVINNNGTSQIPEKVTGIRYNYQKTSDGKLNNTVKSFMRVRGFSDKYDVQDISLGKDVDFTVDSRESYSRNFDRDISANLNVMYVFFGVIAIPTFFAPDKEDIKTFRSQVSTKIIQQYGILSSVESYDHGAKSVTENLIYDSETGQVMLSRTNTEFNDHNYELKYPSYLAYPGMGGAYQNAGYEEYLDSLKIPDYNANPQASTAIYYTQHPERFTPGDELLLVYKPTDGSPQHSIKLWVDSGAVAARTVYAANGYGDGGAVQNLIPLYYYDGVPGLLSPRYSYSINGSTISSIWNWIAPNTLLKHVYVRVLRSAKRNNLTSNVQTALFSQNPYNNDISDLFLNNGNNNNTFNKCLSVKTDLFSDVALPYTFSGTSVNNIQHPDTVGFYDQAIPGYRYAVGLNVYVNGRKGTYRNWAEYSDESKRVYGNHARYDGAFVYSPFWGFANNTTPVLTTSYSDVYRDTSASGGHFTNPWAHLIAAVQPNHIISTFDVFGNALEEVDAAGNYSAVQYGYNMQLPVAVASNSKQSTFVFEGFEDKHMLQPEKRSLYTNSTYQYSPFAHLFINKINVGQNYPADGNSNVKSFIRNGQAYNLFDSTSSSPFRITQAAAHTGSHSLISTVASNSILIYQRGPNVGPDSSLYSFSGAYLPVAKYNIVMGGPPHFLYQNVFAGYVIQHSNVLFSYLNPFFSKEYLDVNQFQLAPTKKYIFNYWAKAQSGAMNPIYLNYTLSNGSSNGAVQSMVQKTGSIDGWYLFEGTFDLTNTAYNSVAISIPGGYYFDDFRMYAADANMKSFVYDPLTFKEVAQLDENHFATYYEYDQEGLLVRVKKETNQGIMTVSESRRSNAKQ